MVLLIETKIDVLIDKLISSLGWTCDLLKSKLMISVVVIDSVILSKHLVNIIFSWNTMKVLFLKLTFNWLWRNNNIYLQTCFIMKDNCKYYFLFEMKNSVIHDFILLISLLCLTLKWVDSSTESPNKSVITHHHNKILKNSYVFMEWKEKSNLSFSKNQSQNNRCDQE